MKDKIIYLAFVLMLEGCGIGGFWMEGNPYAEKPKPYLDNWIKEGGDTLTASIECEGGADRPLFTKMKLTKEKRPDEQDILLARDRLFDQWQRCMIKKGYSYTGRCYDTEISRNMPACGAP